MRATVLLLVFLLLFQVFIVLTIPAASAQEGRTIEAPDIVENAVWESYARGSDNTYIYARFIPPREYSPEGMYNEDNTLYPGDNFKVKVQGQRSGWYDRVISCWGAVYLFNFSVGEVFSEEIFLRIRTDQLYGLREVKIGLFPAKGQVEIDTVDEAGFSGTRVIYINDSPVGTGKIIQGLEQGTYTISFEQGPENTRTPPPVTVDITPGRYVQIVGRYAFENGIIKESTGVTIVNIGSPSILTPVIAKLVLPVIAYNPRFVVIPYLVMNWGTEKRYYWSYELPNAVLVRYDGNRYDPENENKLSLNQRAIVDGISIVGIGSWPITSMGEQQRYCDNGDLDFYENGDPVMYRDGDKLYNDNGVVKFQYAVITAKPAAENTALFYFGFQPLENIRESVYSLVSIYGYEMLGTFEFWSKGPLTKFKGDRPLKTYPGSGPFGADVDVYGFTDTSGNPISFHYGHRAQKYLFFIERDVRSIFADWRGTLSLEIAMWSLEHEKITFETVIGWTPSELVQPVNISCWRLAPWAKAIAETDPSVVYMDNAWVIDESIRFKASFVPVCKFDEFMNMVRTALENVSISFPREIENYIPQEYRVEQYLPWINEALYSILNLDPWMLNEIKLDAKWSDDPQFIEGAGSQFGEIERRGLPLFALELSAWLSPQDIRTRTDLVTFSFENKMYQIDINLRGEGMVVEVMKDTGGILSLRLHTPARSGGLNTVKILDNEGKVLFQRTFLPPSLYQLPWLPKFIQIILPDPYAPQDITFYKTPSTPTRITVELTNFWGAKYTKELEILPFAGGMGIAAIPWMWLIIACVFLALWASFINWLAKRRAVTAQT